MVTNAMPDPWDPTTDEQRDIKQRAIEIVADEGKSVGPFDVMKFYQPFNWLGEHMEEYVYPNEVFNRRPALTTPRIIRKAWRYFSDV